MQLRDDVRDVHAANALTMAENNPGCAAGALGIAP